MIPDVCLVVRLPPRHCKCRGRPSNAGRLAAHRQRDQLRPDRFRSRRHRRREVLPSTERDTTKRMLLSVGKTECLPSRARLDSCHKRLPRGQHRYRAPTVSALVLGAAFSYLPVLDALAGNRSAVLPHLSPRSSRSCRPHLLPPSATADTPSDVPLSRAESSDRLRNVLTPSTTTAVPRVSASCGPPMADFSVSSFFSKNTFQF